MAHAVSWMPKWNGLQICRPHCWLYCLDILRRLFEWHHMYRNRKINCLPLCYWFLVFNSFVCLISLQHSNFAFCLTDSLEIIYPALDWEWMLPQIWPYFFSSLLDMKRPTGYELNWSILWSKFKNWWWTFQANNQTIHVTHKYWWILVWMYQEYNCTLMRGRFSALSLRTSYLIRLEKSLLCLFALYLITLSSLFSLCSFPSTSISGALNPSPFAAPTNTCNISVNIYRIMLNGLFFLLTTWWHRLNSLIW